MPSSSTPPSQGSTPPALPSAAAPGSTQQPMRPIPDQNLTPGSKVNSSTNLRLLDPDNRTTSVPGYQPWAYTPVAWNAVDQAPAAADIGAGPTTTLEAPAEDDGWRTSNR
jgi:hypothetical protein